MIVIHSQLAYVLCVKSIQRARMDVWNKLMHKLISEFYTHKLTAGKYAEVIMNIHKPHRNVWMVNY